MKLKLGAIQVLLTGLQPKEMGVIYLMATGVKEMPETVTKSVLTNIIAFLCSQLDWIENDEDENIELTTKSVTKSKKGSAKGNKNILNTTIKTPEEQNSESGERLDSGKEEIPIISVETNTPEEIQSNSDNMNIENYLDEVFEDSKTENPLEILNTEAEKDTTALKESSDSVTIKTVPNYETMKIKFHLTKKIFVPIHAKIEKYYF